MRFMQIESVLQTINLSEPAKNRFSVALPQRPISYRIHIFICYFVTVLNLILSFLKWTLHETLSWTSL